MSDVKGIEIHDILGLEEPLTKLIECVSSGIGKIYEPTHIKRIAKAKQEEIRVIGETVSQNINLPTSYENGNIYIDATSADELIKRTENRLLYTELRKQQNIEAIIGEAYTKLQNEESVTNEPVDQDWLFSFFNNAGEITEEKMQKIWGNILAGEIIRPKTYTLRTLSTLKNITAFEANLFEEVVPYSFSGIENSFIYNDTKLLEKYGITYSDLLKLADCGLISLNGVSINYDEQGGTIYNDNIILFVQGKTSVSVYKMTESVNQVISVIKERIKSNDSYFLEMCQKIKNDNPNIKVKAFNIISRNEKNIQYDNEKELLENLPIVDE